MKVRAQRARDERAASCRHDLRGPGKSTFPLHGWIELPALRVVSNHLQHQLDVVRDEPFVRVVALIARPYCHHATLVRRVAVLEPAAVRVGRGDSVSTRAAENAQAFLAAAFVAQTDEDERERVMIERPNRLLNLRPGRIRRRASCKAGGPSRIARDVEDLDLQWVAGHSRL